MRCEVTDDGGDRDGLEAHHESFKEGRGEGRKVHGLRKPIRPCHSLARSLTTSATERWHLGRAGKPVLLDAEVLRHLDQRPHHRSGSPAVAVALAAFGERWARDVEMHPRFAAHELL